MTATPHPDPRPGPGAGAGCLFVADLVDVAADRHTRVSVEIDPWGLEDPTRVAQLSIEQHPVVVYADLTPALARDLAHALTEWATR